MTGARWLVTGAGGMLGRDVVQVLADASAGGGTGLGGPGGGVTAATRADLDVTDGAAVAAAVAGHDVVVNCAAWTAVDDAEAHEPDAFAVNAVGAAHLARACARSGAALVHVSTDYVFDGVAPRDATGRPRPYAEDDVPAPRTAYGRTKAAGEWAVRTYLPDRSWVVRTAWLYGAHGPNFVRTMARLEATRDVVDVVADQEGQPTWSLDVARRLVALVAAGAPAGTYHATASGSATWCDLARAVFELAGADPARVRATTSAAYPRPAPRPAWSVLGHTGWERAGLAPLPPWRRSLEAAMRATDLLEPQ